MGRGEEGEEGEGEEVKTVTRNSVTEAGVWE